MGNDARSRGVAVPSEDEPTTPAHAGATALVGVPGPAAAERFLLPPGLPLVQLRWSRTDLDADTLRSMRADLDAATLARSERMARPQDAARVVVAHALLRRALGTRYGIAPAHVRLTRRCDRCDRYGDADHGRLLVVPPGGGPAPELSISHGGTLAVVALAAPGHRVGVDVEPTRPAKEWLDGLTHLMTPVERWIARGAPDDRGLLARAWTGKEAVAKATGRGLGEDTAEIDVLGAPCADPGRVWWRTAPTSSSPSALLAFPTLGAAGSSPHHVALAVLHPSPTPDPTGLPTHP